MSYSNKFQKFKSAVRKNRLVIGIAITFLFTSSVLWTAAQLWSTYSFYAAQLDQKLKDQVLHLPKGIYAAPRRVMAGQQISISELTERLLRAGYQPGTQASQFAAGNFEVQGNMVTITTNEFARSEQLPTQVRVFFGAGKSSKKGASPQQVISVENAIIGQSLPLVALSAEMMTADLTAKGQAHHSLHFQEIPPVLTQALLATEDRRFYSHFGVDPRGIVRALWRNWRAGRVSEGASTLTQQLVKNNFLTPERTWQRKLAEAMMAVALEQRFSKEQILALFCDRVYLGHSGLSEVYGFKQGAQVWFGKKLADLTASDAALLVGLIKSPNRYKPDSQKEAAIGRRNTVLRAMHEAGYLTAEATKNALSDAPMILAPQTADAAAAPHFIDFVRRELEQQNALQTEPEDYEKARVETTVDPDLQEAATSAVKYHLNRITKLTRKKSRGQQPEAAMIALDPKTGEILAMVGGSDYLTSQINRVTDAKRQPGSVFKPMVYAAALSRGISPATTYLDAPQTFEFATNAVYKPRNFHGGYSNSQVMLREAIVRSLNVVTVEAAQEVGLGAVASFAERAGLPCPDIYPSMALGAFEVTPLDVARAYSVFANGGVRVEPHALRVTTSSGYRKESSPSKTSVLPASLAYVVTDTLSDVVNRGTATQIRRAGFKGAVAGKTGTSRDAWFAGYTPNLLVVVWVGFDDNQDLGLTGGEAAVPIFSSFLQRALQLRPDLTAATFAQPSGLEEVRIDPETGMIADKFCPGSVRMKLPYSLLPMICSKHYENWQEAEAFEATLTAGNGSKEIIVPQAVSMRVSNPESPANGDELVLKAKR